MPIRDRDFRVSKCPLEHPDSWLLYVFYNSPNRSRYIAYIATKSATDSPFQQQLDCFRTGANSRLCDH